MVNMSVNSRSHRAANGFHHLGDIMFRIRTDSNGTWRDYDTAQTRQPVHALAVSSNVLAAADLSPTLPADLPLQNYTLMAITRRSAQHS